MSTIEQEMITQRFNWEEDLSQKQKNVPGLRKLQYIVYTLGILCIGMLVFGFALGATKYLQMSSEVKEVDKDVAQFRLQAAQLSLQLVSLEQQMENQGSHAALDMKKVEGEISKLQSKVSRISTEVQNNKDELSSLKGKVWDEKPCPCGWRHFSGYCYYFSKGYRTWEEAKQYCLNQDSELTMIKSEAELQFIEGTIRLNHWVGLNDLQRENDWKWLDGSSVTKTFWLPGEPNDHGKEDCGEIKNGRLNDMPCSFKQHWICQRAP
ncbi:CD209 antigen-like protein C isoform X3 [Lepisosteus oculatus]